MTTFNTPKKVLDEFHSYMGSGLSMEYHINGMPEKMFIEELAQRDVRHGHKEDREHYREYIQALCLQKKLLRTAEGKLFTYTVANQKILEEKGLIPEEKQKTRWGLVAIMILATLLLLYMGTYLNII
jgi:hypothetical protein